MQGGGDSEDMERGQGGAERGVVIHRERGLKKEESQLTGCRYIQIGVIDRIERVKDRKIDQTHAHSEITKYSSDLGNQFIEFYYSLNVFVCYI